LLLIEGFFDAADLDVFAKHAFTAVVHDAEQVAMIERTPLRAALDVYLKVNSGMNRLGFRPADARSALERLQASGKVGSVTLMTHFADADGPRGVAEPMALMEKMSQGLALPRSAANSAALLRFPQTHFDWVRPGIMLYGCSPFPEESAESLGLVAAMTLKSALIGVQELSPGERVGYAGLFEAEKPTRVGIAALGYADGYPRHAPVGTPVLVNGRRSRTVGRVSMDMIFVDLTGMPDAGIGTPVTLWGEGLSADEVATAAGTVSYELLCALTPRVPVDVIE
jgi:alanine racemase